MIVTFISLLPYGNKINSCRTINISFLRTEHPEMPSSSAYASEWGLLLCYPQPGQFGEGRPEQPFGFSATMFKVVHIRPSGNRVYLLRILNTTHAWEVKRKTNARHTYANYRSTLLDGLHGHRRLAAVAWGGREAEQAGGDSRVASSRIGDALRELPCRNAFSTYI